MKSDKNPNFDGSVSKEVWNNSSKERRINQSKLMSTLNVKLKTKPKEFREYECEVCRDTFYAEELTHHHRRLNPTCSPQCKAKRLALFNKQNKGLKVKRPYKRKNKRIAWNKGISNSGAGICNPMHNLVSIQKLKNTIAGRKREYREDGSWYWKNRPTTSVSEQVGIISES